MPRGPRLDAPGALHHVMVRGIERRAIFRQDADRADVLDRLAGVRETTGLAILAWALLPNHGHLVVRTGPRPLAHALRHLLTGYAGTFNRRHRRSGHLLQNRYKSILVEEDPYLLELVRFLHLNPLRASLVPTLGALDRYPSTGHSALLGRVRRPWQAVGTVRARFGRGRGARRGYRAFVAAGIARGQRPDLQGGGLRRSLGGWDVRATLRRGREQWVSDERVLGSGAFVAQVLREADRPPRPWGGDLGNLVAHVARALGVSLQSVLRGVERGARLLAAHGAAPKALLRKL